MTLLCKSNRSNRNRYNWRYRKCRLQWEFTDSGKGKFAFPKQPTSTLLILQEKALKPPIIVIECLTAPSSQHYKTRRETHQLDAYQFWIMRQYQLLSSFRYGFLYKYLQCRRFHLDSETLATLRRTYTTMRIAKHFSIWTVTSLTVTFCIPVPAVWNNAIVTPQRSPASNWKASVRCVSRGSENNLQDCKHFYKYKMGWAYKIIMRAKYGVERWAVTYDMKTHFKYQSSKETLFAD